MIQTGIFLSLKCDSFILNCFCLCTLWAFYFVPVCTQSSSIFLSCVCMYMYILHRVISLSPCCGCPAYQLRDALKWTISCCHAMSCLSHLLLHGRNILKTWQNEAMGTDSMCKRVHIHACTHTHTDTHTQTHTHAHTHTRTFRQFTQTHEQFFHCKK